MIIKFTRDYTGRETAMKAYRAGEQVDLPNAQALELIRLGVAKETWAEIGKLYDPPAPVAPAPPEPPVEEAQPKPRNKRKVKRDENPS